MSSASASFFVASFFGALADRNIIPEAAEEKLDFGEGEIHLAGEAKQQQP